MTSANDISKLFKQIGVSEADYQEINKQNGARESQARWPLLDSLHAQATRAPEVDVSKRIDVDADVPRVTSGLPSAGHALFPHIASDDTVRAHQLAHAALQTGEPVDPHATHAAMNAVDAAPAIPPATPQRKTSEKIAEFIAPRGGLLSSLVRPGAARHAAQQAAAGPVSAPTASDALFAPQLSALAHPPIAAQAPVAAQAPASLPLARTETGLTPSASAPVALGGLFARLANPGAATETETATPTAASAPPKSLFERLIRS